MVDLDSNPTKLIEIVEIGKQLLITRGSLTTFSIANDVAKYFAIIPAMFVGVFPQLDALNIMHLAQPRLGDPLGRHLQRADHRRARSRWRCAACGSGRVGAAAVLRRNLLDLRRRRAHRAVHRHQAHRPRRSAGTGSAADAHANSLACAAVAVLVSHASLLGRRPTRSSSPAVAPARLPRPGRRLADQAATGAVGRLLAHRPAFRRSHGRRPAYFQPRPSAAGDGYDGDRPARRLEPRPDQPRPARRRRRAAWPPTERRTGSPTTQRARRRRDRVRLGPRPAHLASANARLQAPRVAAARGLDARRRSLALVDEHTDGRSLGFLGEPGVNVLELNLALDAAAAAESAQTRDRWPRHAAHLPRRRARRGQDVRHARTRAGAGRARHRRRGRLRRDPRPAADRRAARRPRGRPAGDASSYRGATFEEMDVDAVLARRPEVALVDELAHTNVPGSPQREALAGRRGAARRRAST